MPPGGFDGVIPLEIDKDSYLTTNVLDTFTEPLSIGYHHVDVIVIILGAGINTSGTGEGLCVAIFMMVLGFKSVLGPCRVFVPG